MSVPAETINRIQHLQDDQIAVIMDLIGFYEKAPQEQKQSGTFINRIGDVIMITPLDRAKDVFMNSFNLFSDDFMENGRPADVPVVRESL